MALTEDYNFVVTVMGLSCKGQLGGQKESSVDKKS